MIGPFIGPDINNFNPVSFEQLNYFFLLDTMYFQPGLASIFKVVESIPERRG
jgi:hypothetical protein